MAPKATYADKTVFYDIYIHFCTPASDNSFITSRGHVVRHVLIYHVCFVFQKQLVPVLTAKQPMTCSDIQSFAFSTHALCYSDPPLGSPSFCDLPFTDWLRISWIVKQSFVRETSETVKQVAQILGSCASHSLTSLFG